MKTFDSISKAEAQAILDSGKELFDLIVEKDVEDGQAKNAVLRLRRDAGDYAGGKWEAKPERAWEVISDELFTALHLAANLGIIPRQADLEISLASEPARSILLSRYFDKQ